MSGADYGVRKSGAGARPHIRVGRAASDGRTDGAADSAVINMTAGGQHEEPHTRHTGTPHVVKNPTPAGVRPAWRRPLPRDGTFSAWPSVRPAPPRCRRAAPGG